jgi:hypothetical protein
VLHLVPYYRGEAFVHLFRKALRLWLTNASPLHLSLFRCQI